MSVVFGEHGNCNWREVVAVASGADAQDRYFKQVDPQMGKVSNYHVSPPALTLEPCRSATEGGQQTKE